MRFDRLIKAVAAALVICMLAGSAAIAQETVQIYGEQTINAEVGATFDFPVYIKNNPGICKFVVSIAFDDEIIEPVEGSEQTGEIASTIIANPSYMNKPETRVAGIHPENLVGDGLLFTYKFRVKDTAKTSTAMTVSVANNALSRLGDDLAIENIACESAVSTVVIGSGNPGETPVPGGSDEIVTTPAPAVTAVPSKPSAGIKENAAEIKYMAAYGKRFEPDRDATRYEVIEALYALLDFKNLKENKKEFTDMDDAHRDMADAMYQTSIIDGYPDGTFCGDKSITRAEFVKVVSIAAGIASNASIECDLSDITGHWAQPYIASFVNEGYIYGYPDKTFLPDSNITRAEVVAIINRVTGINKSTEAVSIFEDVESEHWAYGDIMAVAVPAEEQ